MKITLEAWAARNFDPPPKIGTLRAWAKAGSIRPAPLRIGRYLMVDDSAQYVPFSAPMPANADSLSDRAAQILKAA